MKTLLLPILSIFLCGQLHAQGAPLTRTSPINIEQVPLAPGAGLVDRDADHATVAMNSERDIVVAFHTSRTDISQTMKQVEYAYYEWQSGDTWTHLKTEVIGSTGHNPLGLNQQIVKCERPDVVAVGDKFFIIWTRRYQSASEPNEPAVLECAWLEKSSPGVVAIRNNGLAFGLGFELDAHVPNPLGLPGLREFYVKDCAGVPDAVILNDAGLAAGSVKVAVVYPHQTDGFTSGTSGARKFDSRVITCTLDSANTLTKGPFEDLQNQIPFNGPTSPGGGASAGLILPDLAPSPEDNAFWLIAETQTMAVSLPHGKIRLQYWQFDAGTGSWELQASKTYKSPSFPYVKPYVRRRPNVSSFPEVGLNPTVTLAFNKKDPNPPVGGDGSTNVVLDQVEYDGNGFVTPTTPLALWPNDPAFGDGKPVPLRGKVGASIPSCFADRAPGLLATCDIVTNNLTVLDTNAYDSVARPAAAYHYHLGAANPHYVVPIWEKKIAAGGPTIIWIGVF